MKLLRVNAALKSAFLAAAVVTYFSYGQAVAAPTGTDSNIQSTGPESVLAPSEAEARYQDGLRLERGGDLHAAVNAYLAAAVSGHGMAQRKLGDIYGTGKGGIERDYMASLKWYERSQEQGIEILNKPFVYPGVRR
jgi:TPR repeat protein